MAVRAISSSKKITVELDINVEKIEYKKDENGIKFSQHNFVIPLSDGTCYNGRIYIFIFGEELEHDIFLFIRNLKSLSGTVSLLVSKGLLTKGKVLNHCEEMSATENKNFRGLSTKCSGQLDFLKGSYTITFEPCEDKLLQENIINSFSLLKLESFKRQNDVKLVVKDQELEFNMSSLTSISPFFKEMFENCPGENKVPMINCEPQHIQILQKILDKKWVSSEEITLDLFEFADKFQIEPLLKICGEHFGKNINVENMFTIANLANMVNDDHLMGKVAKFFTMHPGKDVETFLKNNPDCCARLFQAMIHFRAC